MCENFSTAYFLIKDYEENGSDYGHVRQQFMNLQAAQKSISKKSEEVTNDQFSKSSIDETPVELKEGDKSLKMSYFSSISYQYYFLKCDRLHIC